MDVFGLFVPGLLEGQAPTQPQLSLQFRGFDQRQPTSLHGSIIWQKYFQHTQYLQKLLDITFPFQIFLSKFPSNPDSVLSDYSPVPPSSSWRRNDFVNTPEPEWSSRTGAGAWTLGSDTERWQEREQVIHRLFL